MVLLTLAAPAHGGGRTVGPSEDSPPGCATATAEDQEQCGAQGRDHFANANHVPPIDACNDKTTASGSRVTRITPDGPRRADGSMAFVSGACVYLPPGFDPDRVRYPTLYLLHGGGGDQADWVTFGRVVEILERVVAADPGRGLIAVMPDGRSGQWYDYEDGSFLIESYVLDHLIPWVDANLPTIPDRAGRAIAGLSNGGYGAIQLAGKRPDLFVAAGGMSSNLGARALSGLGQDGGIHHQGSVPFQLAENYDEVDVVLDVATRCTSPDPLCATVALDLAFVPDHLAFDSRADDIAHEGVIDLRLADGGHQFAWWSRWLEERQLPFLLERLSGPVVVDATPRSQTPESFRYRSIAAAFSVWGTDVVVDRDVREFLDLRDVTAGGFRVRGSGTARVTTAPYFESGTTVRVLGASDSPAQLLVADDAGRITVPVDLGPSSGGDEFSAEADVAEAVGSYKMERDVVIEPLGSETESLDPRPAVVDTTPLLPAETHPTGAALRALPGPTEGPPVADSLEGDPSGLTVEEAAPVTERSVPVPVGPQLVPTILFVAAIAAAATLLRRRRRSPQEIP